MEKLKTPGIPERFNIRVYGIAIENNHILLADEIFKGIEMTKFPGGGLEFGEGPIDCLKREAIEEFNCHIEIINHFYTTDYYQPALFYNNTQLISIYYRIRLLGKTNFPISEKPYYPKSGQLPNFRWALLTSFNPQNLTFPIDKRVAEMINGGSGIIGS